MDITGLAKAERLEGRRPRTKNQGDRLFKGLVSAFGMVVLLLVAAILYELIRQAMPAFKEFGIGFLFSQEWNPTTNEYGALTFIFGTVVTSLIGLLFAGIVGIGVSVFIVELAPRLLRRPIGFVVELLAAVPSVIFGFWGIYVMIPFLQSHVYPWLTERLGFIPFLAGPAYGPSIFAAGVVLAIMILPTVASVSRDVMAAVPGNQKQAMLALGATHWEVIRCILLPQASSGIIGALVLGLGRALGETMAVVMVIGNNRVIPPTIFQPGTSMTTVIATNFGEASGIQQPVLLEIALVLFLVITLLNMGARLLVWRVSSGNVGAEGRLGG